MWAIQSVFQFCVGQCYTAIHIPHYPSPFRQILELQTIYIFQETKTFKKLEYHFFLTKSLVIFSFSLPLHHTGSEQWMDHHNGGGESVAKISRMTDKQIPRNQMENKQERTNSRKHQWSSYKNFQKTTAYNLRRWSTYRRGHFCRFYCT